MKKIKLLLFILLFMFITPIVDAGSFSVSSNVTSVTVGSKVKVVVKTNEAAGYFVVSSSNSSVLSGGKTTDFLDNSSSTIEFTANAVGTATITVIPKDLAGYDEVEITGSKSIKITVKPKETIPSNQGSNSGSNYVPKKTKSSINNLTSLSVEGAELNPKFDKNTTEYEVVLENGTDKVNVVGVKESNVSYISGVGEISVSEGVNFINVVVTAENGAKKTYIIKATVLEEDPIIVNVNNQDMTLIRKAEFMPLASDYYVNDTVTINDKEIPCYISEVTGYILVGLKGSDGNTSLYRYDKNTNSYLDYKELGFNVLRISLLEPDLIPEGYVVGSINVNEQEIVAYTKEGEYPLVYGINLENGEKSFYSYDVYENTIQRFSVDEKEPDFSNYYLYIILGLLLFILIQFFIIIRIIVSKNKKYKKLLSNKLNVNTEYENDDNKKSILKDINKKNVEKEKKLFRKKSNDDNMYKF